MTTKGCSMTEFAVAFRTHFADLGAPNKFLDSRLSSMAGHPILDPIALDDAIIARHGQYPDGVSLREFIEKQYGQAAAAFVKEMM